MGIVISFANQKGGVGKTTSAINVAAALGMLDKKILLCDMDPQSNATSGVRVVKRGLDKTIYNVLIGECDIRAAIISTEYKNLSILPSNINLAGGEIELIESGYTDNPKSKESSGADYLISGGGNDVVPSENRKFYRLKQAILSIKDDFDYILIDCPPSLGILTLNAFIASDMLIVPMQCEFFALEGLSQLTQTIKIVKKLYNPSLALGGILITMYDGRLNLSLQVMEELKKFFPDKIFKTPIPRAVRLSEAPSHGMPILYYDKTSKGTESYMDAAKEINELMV